MSIVPFDRSLISLIRRVLSVAETGKPAWNPAEIFVYRDDNRFNPPRRQITLSIGFTESGNLKQVLQRYVLKGGKLSGQFAAYLPGLGAKGSASRADDSKFKALLREASGEAAMIEAQEECFDEFYLEPAFSWASVNGFALPLSYLVIADSFLHSGSMLGFLMNRFSEKKPKFGGNEKVWIQEYLRVRKQWLGGHSNKILNKTVYRATCYLAELGRDNWNLETGPIVMNGTPVDWLA
jgi:chitosanase